MVVEGATPVEEDGEGEVEITMGDPDADSRREQNGESSTKAGEGRATAPDAPKERRELVLANECRLHPGENKTRRCTIDSNDHVVFPP